MAFNRENRPIQDHHQKRVHGQFLLSLQGRSRKIPTNVIAKNLRDYADKLDQIEKIFAFVFCLLLFFSSRSVQAEDVELLLPQEEIAGATSEDALNYLLSEEMYLGTLSWQGNKASTKFNYDIKKENN